MIEFAYQQTFHVNNCKYCGKLIKLKVHLCIHKKKCHTNVSHKCENCRKYVEDKVNVFFHKERFHVVDQDRQRVCLFHKQTWEKWK